MPKLTSSTDVIVIGAGVHGAAAARGLAERGVTVRILEQATIAAGPTGRSSAICRAYYTDPFLAACARVSIAEFTSGSLAGVAGFRRTGGVYLHGAAEAGDAGRVVERLTAAGGDFELIDPGQVGAIVHPDSPTRPVELAGIELAVWEPGAGHADPYLTTRELLRQARVGRVVVEEHQRVVAVRPGWPAGC